MGNPWRDIDTPVIFSRNVETRRIAISWASYSKIVKDDSSNADRHVPVVGLMQVIVQANESTCLFV